MAAEEAAPAAVAEQQYRCAFCKEYFPINRFGLDRNDQRAKVCIDCDIARDRFRELIAEQTELIQTTDIEVRPHPIYVNYGATRTGICVNMTLNHAIGKLLFNGYINLTLHYEHRAINMRAHRFIYEVWNGMITNSALVIKHLDNDPRNNAIINLMLDTQSANMRDAWNDGMRDRTRVGKRRVIASNLDTTDIREFASMSIAGRELDIHSGSVQFCCDGIYDSARSRTTGARYSFRYAD